ncbi:hypothetical protein TcWFU_001568 [Taenia crassiceps]|uniref:Uncharacterized protein n=1 Tax=Taenia crassiceps TaxID=6207 RepID=A0ABR4QJQ7_9CEST
MRCWMVICLCAEAALLSLGGLVLRKSRAIRGSRMSGSSSGGDGFRSSLLVSDISVTIKSTSAEKTELFGTTCPNAVPIICRHRGKLVESSPRKEKADHCHDSSLHALSSGLGGNRQLRSKGFTATMMPTIACLSRPTELLLETAEGAFILRPRNSVPMFSLRWQAHRLQLPDKRTRSDNDEVIRPYQIKQGCNPCLAGCAKLGWSGSVFTPPLSGSHPFFALTPPIRLILSPSPYRQGVRTNVDDADSHTHAHRKQEREDAIASVFQSPVPLLSFSLCLSSLSTLFAYLSSLTYTYSCPFLGDK